MDDLDLGIIGLFFPEYAQRVLEARKEEEQRTFRWLCTHEQPQDWDEDSTYFNPNVLYLKASTWKPTLLFDVPPLRGEPGSRLSDMKKKEGVVTCPGGRFHYCNHVLPKGSPLSVFQGRERGRVWFDDDIVSPALSEVIPGKDKPKVWMGLTPMEVFTQRQGVRLATGRVVVGGLGLGWFLNKVASKPSVTTVVVVEKEQILVDWLTPRLMTLYPAVAAKTTWVVDDVWDFLKKDSANHAHSKYLLDIWETYGGIDQKFERWQRHLGRRLWGWGKVET